LRQTYLESRRKRLPLLTEDALRKILVNDLGIEPGNVVFIHSSINNLSLGFPFFRTLKIVQDVLGGEGTMLFPTYPQLSSYNYLMSGEVFDVRKTPSFTGALTEFARRQRNAIRSLHPTKSVCALGPHAECLTDSHHNSPYPYDNCSPYYKLKEQHGSKIIGLGVTSHNLSFVHCVEDVLKDKFPLRLYHPNVFEVKCIDSVGSTRVVRTFAHDMNKINHNIPGYMRKHVPKVVCNDITILGRQFFTAKASELFDLMLDLARSGTTIYSRRSR
jgi:aminoglycoside 3-N-acetyltransferase